MGNEKLSLYDESPETVKEGVEIVSDQFLMNIPGKILPPCVNEKPKGDVQQSYSFRIFNGLMNYVFGTAYIAQQTLEEQSRKNLEQKSEHTPDGMYKPGLTQIFKVNTQYPRR